jgi:hypothetical protein
MKNLQFPLSKKYIRTISIPVSNIKNGTENLGLLSSFCLAQKKKSYGSGFENQTWAQSGSY